jgi:NitT/TauT family transport system substrate-binding protein
MATEEFAAQNPEVVEAFVRALNKSTEYAAEHEDEIRAIIPTFTSVPEEIAAQIRLPHYDTDLNEDGVAQWIEYALEYGVIDEEITVDDLLLDTD